VPVETPGFLTLIIAIIETVRRVIHPATLAARLAANIVASHLLPTLLGLQAPSPNKFSVTDSRVNYTPCSRAVSCLC